MSQSTPVALDADHAGRAEKQRLRTLFKAHTSPAFTRLVAQQVLDQDLSFSLANCEKVLTSGSANQPEHFETLDDAGHVSDAMEALYASLNRSRSRQLKVIGLVQEGEIAHANRLALCRRQSVQLECPELGGGCGSEENFVPVSCDSRLCPDCMDRKLGRVAEQYRREVASWDYPSMIRLSLPERVDRDELSRGIDALRGAFNRLRRRVIPVSGQHQSNRWVWKYDGNSPADRYWKSALLDIGAYDQARRLQKQFVECGRGIPFTELCERGFYGIDIKQKEDGRFNIHLHILADLSYIPQEALSSVWDDIIGAPVVDIRRIRDRNQQSSESALLETVGYAAKAPEFETIEDEVSYLTALKGTKLIQPFGDLHGNTPSIDSLLRCCACEVAPAYWNYLGYVDGHYETMLVGAASDGDRPPP